MVVTRNEILLQNQRDSRALAAYTIAMREMLISEMETFQLQQNWHNRTADQDVLITQIAIDAHLAD